MASLLRLLSAESQNSDVVNSLQEAVGRINSMAFIHERMYQKENLDHIDLQSYLNELSISILEQLEHTDLVCVDIQCDPINVKPDAMVSLSLLMNELLTNSVKHAFRTGEGEVKIIIKKRDSSILMSYSDNGSWRDPSNLKSFGYELMSTLTEQSEGKMDRTSNDTGTHYSFIFPHRVIAI